MNEDNTLTGRTVLAEAALLLIKLHVKGQSTPLYITSSTPQKLLQAGFPNNWPMNKGECSLNCFCSALQVMKCGFPFTSQRANGKAWNETSYISQNQEVQSSYLGIKSKLLCSGIYKAPLLRCHNQECHILQPPNKTGRWHSGLPFNGTKQCLPTFHFCN